MADIKLKKQNHQMYFRDYRTFNADSGLEDVFAVHWNAITGRPYSALFCNFCSLACKITPQVPQTLIQ